MNVEICNTSEIKLVFEKPSAVDAFIRWNFYSSLLHSLVPSGEGDQKIWVRGNRLDKEIQGWPKGITYNRIDDLIVTGAISENIFSRMDINAYIEELKLAFKYCVEGFDHPQFGRVKKFVIKNMTEEHEYLFTSASRQVVALCILYDQEFKARDQLELWLEPENFPAIKGGNRNNWPRTKIVLEKYYGDPSKTFDELCQQGWEIYGDNTTAEKTNNQNFNGTIQEAYRLKTIEQDTSKIKPRTNFSRAQRISLLGYYDYTCLFCGRKGDPELVNNKGIHPLLDPDHRVPVKVIGDSLNDNNLIEKCMPLCKTCNQRKREETKRLLQDEHLISEDDWSNQEWAHPDNIEFLKDRINNLIKIGALKQSCTPEEFKNMIFID